MELGVGLSVKGHILPALFVYLWFFNYLLIWFICTNVKYKQYVYYLYYYYYYLVYKYKNSCFLRNLNTFTLKCFQEFFYSFSEAQNYYVLCSKTLSGKLVKINDWKWIIDYCKAIINKQVWINGLLSISELILLQNFCNANIISNIYTNVKK